MRWLRWTGPWIMVPTVVLTAYALVSGAYSPRYLAFTSPAVAIVLAAALLSVRHAWVRTTTAVLLVVLAMPAVVSQRTENAKSGADWHQVATYIDDRATPGDGIYFAPRYPSGTDEERLTTRGIAVAYPTPFRELVDVTMNRHRPSPATSQAAQSPCPPRRTGSSSWIGSGWCGGTTTPSLRGWPTTRFSRQRASFGPATGRDRSMRWPPSPGPRCCGS